MRPLGVGFERVFVVVDLVENDFAGVVVGANDVELVAAGFVAHRGARVDFDHLVEAFEMLGFDLKSDDENEIAHA